MAHLGVGVDSALELMPVSTGTQSRLASVATHEML